MDNNIYIEYINSNTESIANYVNSCFELSKDFLKVKLIRKIREYIDPLPIHYIKKFDGNPYDCSGIIVENGIINPNQTVKEFLENEYSGNKEATYISGMGWNYNTYGDELHYYTIELAADIMFPAIRRYIETTFSINLSEDDFERIKESCGEFDEIYDSCIASDFFSEYSAIEFVGIENIKLTKIIQKKG